MTEIKIISILLSRKSLFLIISELDKLLYFISCILKYFNYIGL